MSGKHVKAMGECGGRKREKRIGGKGEKGEGRAEAGT